MPTASEKKIAIIGSSHVSWWEHAINTGQIPKPKHDITFIGLGAMPIWGDFIRNGIDEVADSVDEIFLLLGDFRHGNRILQSEPFLKTGDTSGKYLNIAKELISDENDKILLGLICNFLEELRVQYDQKLRILFWSLTYREFQSLEQGRYGGRGNYRHPVWNLHDLVEQFQDVAIDTYPLMSSPIHSFYLDASGHPTFKGHAFLNRLLNGQSAPAAYQSVSADFEAWGHLLFPENADRTRIKIIGNSIAFETLVKAVRTQYFLLPSTWEVIDLKKQKATIGDYDRIVYFSGLHFDDEDPEQIREKIAAEQANIRALGFGDQVQVVFWDQWAREIVSNRAEYQNKFLPKSIEGYAEHIEAAFTLPVIPLSPIAFKDANGMVELGGSFTPSGQGFAALFHLLVDAPLVKALSRYEEMAAICLNQAHNPTTYHELKPVTALAYNRKGLLLGQFDGISESGKFYGWAQNLNVPEYKVSVYFFLSGQRIDQTTANQLQADFQFDDGGDGGFYGFTSETLPLSLLRNLRVGSEIRASFDAEGKVQLAGSPLKLSQEDLAKLALAAIVARRSEFNSPKHRAGEDYRIPNNGRSLFIAKQIKPENDPAIYPPTPVVLENAVVEYVKRLPDFFRAVIRARVIGGIYRQDGSLEPSALASSGFGVYQLADPILTTTPTQHIDAECIYGGIIIEHYGHFVIESLSRFRGIEQYSGLPIVFTLPNPQITTAADLPNYMKSIFWLLGIGLDRIILVHETTSFKKLIISKMSVRWFDYLDAEHQLALAAQVEANFGKDYPRQKHGSLYLSRSQLNTNHGGNIICGEAQFEAYLAAQGITVIHPEQLHVREQIRLFCSAQNIIGFVGSSFYTLMLCADLPEKIFYLTRNKSEVNPQFPLIDKALGIEGHYLQHVVTSSAKVTVVDFSATSQVFKEAGLVQQTFNQDLYDFDQEFALLNAWLTIKPKARKATAQDVEHLETIVKQCLNPVVVAEAKAFLDTHFGHLETSTTSVAA